MNNNNLIPYKENIFTKISNFFKNLFLRKKETYPQKVVENVDYIRQNKEKFEESLKVQESEDEKRLKLLKFQYDNGEIDEEDISEEDIDKLVKLYEQETEKLNADTQKRKNHISKMLSELKNN